VEIAAFLAYARNYSSILISRSFVVSRDRGVKIEKAASSLPERAFFSLAPHLIYPAFQLFYKPHFENFFKS